ncbi:MAG TPA: DUF2235 domain-containing protein [Pseudolabrys sp.]|nr:DUF2235 domain-containing protein [Pseudolabrys sp.]
MNKNIILFSDGTGNSSSSPFKTNVWRLYQAIDIKPPKNPGDPKTPEQIIYYDNGVGTENFKPIAALGGALGIGVWGNVRDIYTFVCRNYRPGDQIYGFGFSRGAFTIRLLMGLIGKCGLLDADSEAELIQHVQMAYEAYRRDFLIRASKHRHMIYHHVLRPPKYIPDENGNPSSSIDLSDGNCTQIFPDIRFVGVWDTVDAYGMPVDELKIAIDEWVWPMSFADRDPSNRLLTIRHALSLDDERPTFRPVLWNELIKDPLDRRAQPTALDQKRIQQVWFAGVHANVGGGYPDDGLAFTALNWMMDEAHAVGLRYDTLIRDEIAAHVNADGEEYDSRSGIAGYYRYGPRQVGALCNDKDHGVAVPTVRVHPAAFERIAARRRDYEPVSLNCAFSVDAAAKPAADSAAMENAWDLVWWRRLAYFMTLALTAFVGLFALRLVFAWPDVILKCTEAKLQWLWSYVTWTLGPTWSGRIAAWWYWALDHVGAVLPSWADPAIPSFKEYPLSGVVSLALLAWTFFIWSSRLEQRIEDLAEWAWAAHKGLAAAAEPKTDWRNVVARVLRPITGWLYRNIWRGLLVPLLGIAIGVVALVLLSPYWIWRVFRRKPWMA